MRFVLLTPLSPIQAMPELHSFLKQHPEKKEKFDAMLDVALGASKYKLFIKRKLQNLAEGGSSNSISSSKSSSFSGQAGQPNAHTQLVPPLQAPQARADRQRNRPLTRHRQVQELSMPFKPSRHHNRLFQQTPTMIPSWQCTRINSSTTRWDPPPATIPLPAEGCVSSTINIYTSILPSFDAVV